MKATGIVRRIDDLGRVVIPREYRKVINVREGDPLELFLIEDGIIFKKYNPSETINDSIERLIDNIEDAYLDIDTSKSKEVIGLLKAAMSILSDENAIEREFDMKGDII